MSRLFHDLESWLVDDPGTWSSTMICRWTSAGLVFVALGAFPLAAIATDKPPLSPDAAAPLSAYAVEPRDPPPPAVYPRAMPITAIAFSADGKTVTFEQDDPNFPSGGGYPQQLYQRNLAAGTTTLVSAVDGTTTGSMLGTTSFASRRNSATQ